MSSLWLGREREAGRGIKTVPSVGSAEHRSFFSTETGNGTVPVEKWPGTWGSSRSRRSRSSSSKRGSHHATAPVWSSRPRAGPLRRRSTVSRFSHHPSRFSPELRRGRPRWLRLRGRPAWGCPSRVESARCGRSCSTPLPASLLSFAASAPLLSVLFVRSKSLAPRGCRVHEGKKR